MTTFYFIAMTTFYLQYAGNFPQTPKLKKNHSGGLSKIANFFGMQNTSRYSSNLICSWSRERMFNKNELLALSIHGSLISSKI